MASQKLQDANMNADMTKEMVEEARELAIAAFESETQEKAIASHIKHEMQEAHGGIWHCIVGKNFGSFVTHETKAYIYFYVGQMAVLLWKSVS
jgi:dynein light chain LC8-type